MEVLGSALPRRFWALEAGTREWLWPNVQPTAFGVFSSEDVSLDLWEALMVSEPAVGCIHML